MIFINFSGNKAGSAGFQQMVKSAVSPGEKNGFQDSGFIFKRDKFHGIAVCRQNSLSGDQPSSKPNPAAGIPADVFSPDCIAGVRMIRKQSHWMGGAQKPECCVLAAQPLP